MSPLRLLLVTLLFIVPSLAVAASADHVPDGASCQFPESYELERSRSCFIPLECDGPHACEVFVTLRYQAVGVFTCNPGTAVSELNVVLCSTTRIVTIPTGSVVDVECWVTGTHIGGSGSCETFR